MIARRALLGTTSWPAMRQHWLWLLADWGNDTRTLTWAMSMTGRLGNPARP